MCNEKEYLRIKESGTNFSEKMEIEIKQMNKELYELSEKAERELRSILF